MHRIIDVNINRATEAARVLEEIARFELNEKDLAEKLKNLRHKISTSCEKHYALLLASRDTENDIGVDILNPTKKTSIENIFKANIKRLQQALRALAEYSVSLSSECKNVYETARYESYTIERLMWEKLAMKINHFKLKDKKLYLVTNSDKFENDNDFLDAIAAALQGGVQIVQLREKRRPANEIIELGKKIRILCSEFDALFVINDRIDIAQIVEADGVHLGQDDIKIDYARKILGENFIIGISTHEPKQAEDAVKNGADYIGVGPVFATPTKAGRTPVGLDYVKWASGNIKIPFYAIGGIDETNCEEVINTGACRIAVVRAIMNASNPKVAAEKIRGYLK